MNINKKKLIFLSVILVIIVLILLLSFYEFKISKKEYVTAKNEEIINSYEDALIQDEMNKKIDQTFKASHNNLKMIQLNFNPLKEETDIGGQAIIGLKDIEKDEIISEQTIYYNTIRENTKYYFEFDTQKESEGKSYNIYIIFKDNEGTTLKPFAINYSTDSSSVDSQLSIDGINIDGEIAYIDYYKSQNKVTFFYLVSALLSIIVLVTSIYIYKQKNITVEKAFLLSIPLICILFLIFMPTFKNHDELYHWYRIYDIAEGNLVAKHADEVGFIAAHIPQDAIAILENKDWINLKYTDIVELLGVKSESEYKDYTDISTSAVYAPVQYTPQVIGVLITRLISDTPMIIAYGARICNLLFSMIILYFAIKLMPFGKKLLLIPAFIPIAIEGFSSMSPDAMTISICFLFIAYVFNIAFNKEKVVKPKDIICLTILSVLIALCKIVYLPLVALILIIPKEKFKTGKSKIINCCLIFGIAIILNFIWLYIASKYLVTFRDGDSKLQVINILMHPFEYIKILLYTMNVNGYNYFDSLFGGQLGWGELVKLKFITPFILFMLYTIVSIIDNSIKDKFTTFQKVVIILIILAISVLIFTSLYVQWTYVGNDIILGVQGRYFLPFIPLIFILFGSLIKVRSSYREDEVIKITTIISLISQIYVILSLVIAHI